MHTTEIQKLKEKLLLEQYLKNAKRKKQLTYAYFLNKKINEEKLSIQLLTKQYLQTLYLTENLTDKQIAFLFDVNRMDIAHLRTKWRILKNIAS